MQNIIITGASGLVATQLTLLLLEKQQYHLYLLSTQPSKVAKRYETLHAIDRCSCMTLAEFKAFNTGKDIAYTALIHAGFARSSEGDKLADAIQYTYDLMHYATSLNLGCFINISSQSVYGHLHQPLWSENTAVAPDYMYALGKYATEMLCKSVFDSTSIKYTSIRLSSVCENARFVNIFVRNALNHTPIKLTAPEQVVSFIDVSDVADALYHVILHSSETALEPCYNLGTNECYTIRQIALAVKETAKSKFSLEVEVVEEPSGNTSAVGMDSSLFHSVFKWKPTFGINDMVMSLFLYHRNTADNNTLTITNGGGYPQSFKLVYTQET